MATQNRIDFTVGAKVDQNSFNQVKKAFNELEKKMANSRSLVSDEDIQQAERFSDIILNAFNPKTGQLNTNQLADGLKKSKATIEDVRKSFKDYGSEGKKAFEIVANSILKQTKQIKQSNKFLDGMFNSFKNIAEYQINTKIFNSLVNGVQNAISFTKELDKNLTDIQIVTNKSSDGMRQFAKEANAAAKELSVTTNEYASASLIYYQQGLNDNQVKNRTDITAKVSNVTGQTAQQVSEELTAVWNGYKVAEDEAEAYVDKMAKVAASSASSLSELSGAMSKVASAASTSGVSMDQLTAQISTIESVTRQAPESIGTALKTIYARIGDLKVDGVDEFGTKLGEVSSTMEQMGINITDEAGNMREMGAIIEEVAQKWEGWTGAQKQAAAVAMAGKRQYNNLMALFENWGQYESMKGIAEDSEGTLEQQQGIFENSVKGMQNKLKATLEGLYEDIFPEDALKDELNVLTELVEMLDMLTKSLGGGGEALAAFGVILARVFNKQIVNTVGDFRKNIAIKEANQRLSEMQLGAAKSLQQQGDANTESTNLRVKYAERLYELSTKISEEEYNNLHAQQEGVVAAQELYETEVKIGEQILENGVRKSAEAVYGEGEAANNVVSTAKQVLSPDVSNTQLSDMDDRFNELISKAETLKEKFEKINEPLQRFKESFEGIFLDIDNIKINVGDLVGILDMLNTADDTKGLFANELAQAEKLATELENINQKQIKYNEIAQNNGVAVERLEAYTNEMKEEELTLDDLLKKHPKMHEKTKKALQEVVEKQQEYNKELDKAKKKAIDLNNAVQERRTAINNTSQNTGDFMDQSGRTIKAGADAKGVDQTANEEFNKGEQAHKYDTAIQNVTDSLMAFISVKQLSNSLGSIINDDELDGAEKFSKVSETLAMNALMLLPSLTELWKSLNVGTKAMGLLNTIQAAFTKDGQRTLIIRAALKAGADVDTAATLANAAAHGKLDEALKKETISEEIKQAVKKKSIAMSGSAAAATGVATVAILALVAAYAIYNIQRQKAIKVTEAEIKSIDKDIEKQKELRESASSLNELASSYEGLYAKYKETGEISDEFKTASEKLSSSLEQQSNKVKILSTDFEHLHQAAKDGVVSSGEAILKADNELAELQLNKAKAKQQKKYQEKNNQGTLFAKKAAETFVLANPIFRRPQLLTQKILDLTVGDNERSSSQIVRDNMTMKEDLYEDAKKNKLDMLIGAEEAENGIVYSDKIEGIASGLKARGIDINWVGNKDGYMKAVGMKNNTSADLIKNYEAVQDMSNQYMKLGLKEEAAMLQSLIDDNKEAYDAAIQARDSAKENIASLSLAATDDLTEIVDKNDAEAQIQKVYDEIDKIEKDKGIKDLDKDQARIQALQKMQEVGSETLQKYAQDKIDLITSVSNTTVELDKIGIEVTDEKKSHLEEFSNKLQSDDLLKSFNAAELIKAGVITKEDWEKILNGEAEEEVLNEIETKVKKYNLQELKNRFKDFAKNDKASDKEMRELYQKGQVNSENLKSLKKYDELLAMCNGDAELLGKTLEETYSKEPDAQIKQIDNLGKTLSPIINILDAKNTGKTIGSDLLGAIPDELKTAEKEYNNFIEVAGNSKSSMKEVKQAADELATAYFNSTSFIDTLTDKNEDWIASQLKAVGVENAEALAHDLKVKSMVKEDKILKSIIKDKKLAVKESQKVIDKYKEESKIAKMAAVQQVISNGALDANNDALETNAENLVKTIEGLGLRGKVQKIATQIETQAAKVAKDKENIDRAKLKLASAEYAQMQASNSELSIRNYMMQNHVSYEEAAKVAGGKSLTKEQKLLLQNQLNTANSKYNSDLKGLEKLKKKLEAALKNGITVNIGPEKEKKNKKGSTSSSTSTKELKELQQEPEDKSDPYRKVNQELEKLNTNLKKVTDSASKLVGVSKQASLGKQITELEKINKKENERYNIAKKQMQLSQKKAMQSSKKKTGKKDETWDLDSKEIGLKFNNDGTIDESTVETARENVKNLADKATKTYNDFRNKYEKDRKAFEKKWSNKEVKKGSKAYKTKKAEQDALKKRYNQGKVLETSAKNAIKRQNNLETIISDSDEARKIAEESKENIRQNLYDEIDKKVESFKLRFEVRTDISAAHKSLKELQKSMHELNSEGLSTLSKDVVDIAQIAKEDFSGPDGAFNELKTLLNDNNMFKAKYYDEDGKISVEDMEQYKESVQEAYDASIEKFGEIQDAYSQLQEYLVQSVNDWGDAVSKVLEIYSSVNEVLEWQLELTKLIKGENKYADNISNIDSQLENLRGKSKNKEGNYTDGTYGAILAARNKAYELMTTLTNKEAQDAAKELWMDYDSQLRDNLSKQADLVKEKMSQALSQAFDTAFKKSNGGNKSLESLKSDWENASKYANKYKDTVEKNFEINKRISELKMQVDGMSDVYAAQKLNSEMQKEIKHLQEIGKLSQAELDRYDKLYQVKLAQIALENAQNNKNTMRLRRDSQGNYSYVFQADAAEIEKAKQDLENKKYELYEIEKKSIEDSINEYFETFEDLGAQVQRMLESNDYTTEEVEAYIDKQMNQIQLAQDAIIHRIDEFVKDNGEDFAKAFEMTAEDWNKLTDEEKKQKLKETTEKAETDPDSNMNLAFLGPDLQKGLSKVFSGTSDIKTELLNYKSTVTSAYDEQQVSLNSIEESMKQVTKDTKSVNQYLQKNKENAEAEVKKKANEIKETQKNYETVRNIYADLSNYIDGTEYIKNEDGSYKLDENGNLIVDKEKTEKNNKEGKSLKSLLPKIDKVLGGDALTSSSTTGGGSGSGSSGSSSNSGSGSNSKTYTPSKIKSILSKADYAKKGTGKEKSGLNQMLYKKTGYVLKNKDWRGSGGATAIQFFAWAIGADTKGGYSGDGAIAKKLKSAYGFKTGGYTGDWPGLDGKFALLHQKELVLNATDTKNILAAVQELRSLNLDYLTSNIKTKASNILSGMLSEFATAQSTLASSLHAAGADGQVLDQNVHIEASFPNVKDAKEVEAALNNLTSRASQYIHSSEKMR